MNEDNSWVMPLIVGLILGGIIFTIGMIAP